MSVLVTGGAGYIGSHMALELLDAGEDGGVLDNLSTGLAWAVPKSATLVDGDVGDQPWSSASSRATASPPSSILPAPSWSRFGCRSSGYYLNNTVKSRALIEVAVKMRRTPLHLLSTAAVYGMTGDQPVPRTRR
jgi:UDP-glucose 4-epimerase